MKKRIVAILLVLSIFISTLSFGKRTYATGVEAAVVGLVCVAAVSVMKFVTSGAYQDVSDSVVDIVDSVGDEVNFWFNGQDLVDEDGNHYHVNSATQEGYGVFSSILENLQSAFNSGELTQVDGNWEIKGDKIKKVISDANASIGVMARPKVDFTAGYNCTFLDVDLSSPCAFSSLPILSEFCADGQSFAPVFFDDSRLIFSEYFYYFSSVSPLEESSCSFRLYKTRSNYYNENICVYFSASSQTAHNFLDSHKLYLLNSSLSSSSTSCYINDTIRDDYTFENCFVFQNGSITYTPVSDVDVSGMKSGLITTTGNYGDFLKSVDDYSVSTTTVPKLDDLNVVPDDATLSIPVNPDKEVSIPEQVGVSIPGVGDTTLAELQGDLNLDIDIPSIIIDKFPFCIPFDFVRFLGILCADPVAPVFRIPISTNPDNLDGWASNQTIGEYIDPNSPPLFEIDEEIVIDLSHIPLVQPICYTCFIVGFIFLLLHITPKMIQH